MTLVWLLLSTASIFTLKQYAQKILSSLPRTMRRSLEAAPGIWRQRGGRGDPRRWAKGRPPRQSCYNGQMQTSPRGARNRWPIKSKMSGLISKWLLPEPTVQPIWHQGKQIHELRLTALDELISHLLGISILVLTGSIPVTLCSSPRCLTHSTPGDRCRPAEHITEVVRKIYVKMPLLGGAGGAYRGVPSFRPRTP